MNQSRSYFNVKRLAMWQYLLTIAKMNAGLISISFSEMYKHNGNGMLYKNIFLVLLSVAGGIEGASIINFH